MSYQFNVELDETDALRDDIRIWRSCDAFERRPPPMIIEVYVDSEQLSNNQSLVEVDENGRRWDVSESLAAADHGRRRADSNLEVILERWKLELGEPADSSSADLGSILPTVYKKSIVLFRSLFTHTKIVPAWQLAKKNSKMRANSPLQVKYRIFSGTPTPGFDTLTVPLTPNNGSVINNFAFEPIDSPAGPFSIEVDYRERCDFRVENTEALLSSRFAGMDVGYAPSLEEDNRHEKQPSQQRGSLPNYRDYPDQPDPGQAYGSMSTFHQVGPAAGTSPISALRAARENVSQTPSDTSSVKRPSNLRSAQGSRGSLRSTEGGLVGRRPSVSFMPFKTPTLSASPAHGEPPPSPRVSQGKTSALGALSEARSGGNSAANTLTAIKGVSKIPPENAIVSSASSSPKPAPITRYSSSFSHRKGRLSTDRSSNRTDDDNNSSGKASQTSSAQPGSGIIPESGGASSGSIQEDDENISDFLKLLQDKKELKSFNPSDVAASEASAKRTNAALSRFQRMRDSNAALSDSMSSSLLLHRSSSSSSRHLSSVPPMVAATSVSTSSSPGKPISPHTPHTPAIPSRLSAASVVDYPEGERSHRRHRLSHEVHEPMEENSSDDTTRENISNAIDIPTSPRSFGPAFRRSSSAAQRHRSIAVEDEMGDLLPFGLRSASLGTDDRPPLSLSELIGLQSATEAMPPPNDQPAAEGAIDRLSRDRASSIEFRADEPSGHPRGSLNAPYRPRLGRGGGRGLSAQGSISSLDGARGSGSESNRGGRYSFSRPSTFEEDEPLLFALSDIGASRRSLEEGRGGSSAGASERGGGDSNASSKRGSRRGMGSRGGADLWG